MTSASQPLAGPPGRQAAGPTPLSLIEQFVRRHAPYKQIDPRTGAPNAAIGRAPGSACEVIRFLAKSVEKRRASREGEGVLFSLADWIVALQVRDAVPWRGGVPSTPDLAPPADRYHYAIDAALCGDAMLRVFDLTGDTPYRDAAIAFADFLVAMHRPPQAQGAARAGFCEYVIASGRGTWNCDVYVKNLLALPVLKRVTVLTGDTRYRTVAAEARGLLVEGLRGSWEHADARSLAACASRDCKTVWRRVQGPYKEPDHFVYGDTIAYGLRALYEYEGASATVTQLYDEFAGWRGAVKKTAAYDGRIAFAGYLRPDLKAPDDFSAYYDLVTLGILHDLRRAVRPAHATAAAAVLARTVRSDARVGWKMGFDFSLSGGDHVDLSTLANLGEAMLRDLPVGRN